MDYTYMGPKAELSQSDIKGEGIYAKKRIAKEEIIIIFGDVVEEIHTVLEMQKKVCGQRIRRISGIILYRLRKILG
ncbi:MAG: hypothetical protein ACOCUR_02505 [Nanoarchaeota archaeon]